LLDDNKGQFKGILTLLEFEEIIPSLETEIPLLEVEILL